MEPEVFARAEIVPIPAICTGRFKHEWIDGNGNGAIRAPSLRNCCCFYCGANLVAHPKLPPVVDAYARRRMNEVAGQTVQPPLVVTQLELIGNHP